jgi:hypothetical protein
MSSVYITSLAVLLFCDIEYRLGFMMRGPRQHVAAAQHHQPLWHIVPRWVMLRARWATFVSHWVMLRARQHAKMETLNDGQIQNPSARL